MGWRIHEVKNEVIVTEEIAKELFKHEDACIIWDFGDPVSDSDILDYGVTFRDYDGNLKLHFNGDHMEHMDFLHMEWVQDILKKHKAKGDICFSSDDGDNAGRAWGYRFDGEGGMVTLTGKRTWVEDSPTPEPKKKTKKAKR